jgi:methyl-accepting chemotaxis protein
MILRNGKLNISGKLKPAIRMLRDVRRIAAAQHLAAEARAHSPVIPVLSRQLRDTSDEMCSEVGRICEQFQAMAGQARESVAVVSELVGGKGSEQNVGNIIEDCRVTMTGLIDRIEAGGALYRQAIGQMETVNVSVEKIFGILEEVDKTSFGNKLVALNAKIEAVHLGDRGAGFEVVAEQISQQSARSSELTEEVSSILKALTSTMATATTELKRLAEIDRQEAEHSRLAVEEALQSLQAASSKMEGALDKAGGTSGKLVEAINAAIMGLQFQDRLSQRIGHVVDSLDAMSRALSEPTEIEDDAESDRRAQEVRAALLTSYTMASERVAHDAQASSAETGDSEGGDVELF